MLILDNSLSETLDVKSSPVAKVKVSVIPSCCHPESSLTAVLVVAVADTRSLGCMGEGSLEGEDVSNSPGCYFVLVLEGWVPHGTTFCEEVFQGISDSIGDKCRGISFLFIIEN